MTDRAPTVTAIKSCGLHDDDAETLAVEAETGIRYEVTGKRSGVEREPYRREPDGPQGKAVRCTVGQEPVVGQEVVRWPIMEGCPCPDPTGLAGNVDLPAEMDG